MPGGRLDPPPADIREVANDAQSVPRQLLQGSNRYPSKAPRQPCDAVGGRLRRLGMQFDFLNVIGFFAMSDQHEDIVYAAVGRALSKWETLEATLSYTYSIFEGRPVDYELLESYGREGRIFKDRMLMLQQSSENYFRSCPNQNEECRLAAFVTEANRLSTFRHQIAHGLLVRKEDYSGRVRYVVVPPAHGFFHLTKRYGDYYSYDARHIDGFANEFVELAKAVQAFNHERHSPT